MASGDVCHGPRCSLAGLGPVALEYRSCHWPGGSAGSPQCGRPMGCWFFPAPRPPYVCAVSWATWLLFTGVPVGALLCLCGVLGHLAPVHRCARVVSCVASAVSWATWLLFTGAPAWCVVLRVGCPGPLGSCSPVWPLGVLCCVCGVLGHVAPVLLCARSVCCFACAVSWATWLLFTCVPARCDVLRVWCPGSLGSYSPMCPRGLLCCVCGVLGHLAPVHRCACSVCCVACAVSWATWLLFGGVPARCVALLVRCPGPPGSCSPVCPLRLLLCLCGVVGHLAPVHRCAARCTALCVRCPGPLGSCSPVCQAVVSRHFVALGACACAVSWPSWLLFTGVRAVCGAPVPLVVVLLFLPPYFSFLFFFLSFFVVPPLFFWKKGGARTLQAQAWATGAAVQ